MNPIDLIPSFGGLFFTLLAFFIALSVIVAVHEYGHYIIGRLTGIHAEVFSIGFGPVLWSRLDRRGTRWQIAALPLGGFVKFKGDANAASAPDAAAMSKLDEKARRSTMQGAPLWARSATVAAGPIFNFVLAIVVFAGMFMISGVATDRPVLGAIRDLPVPVQELREGDVILSVGGIDTPDNSALWGAIQQLDPAPVVTYRIDRDGEIMTVQGPFPFPPLAANVQPQSAARAAGMQSGDVVLSVGGQPVSAFHELREFVGDSDGAPLDLEVWRGGETLDLELQPRRMDMPLADGSFETRWLLGLSGGLFYEAETRSPGPIEAAGMAVEQTWYIIQLSISGAYHMITGAISTCNLSGPIGIAETSGAMAQDGLASFIWFIAVLSTAVGLINLFPIPVLDGGHLVFHAYEAVTRRPPSVRAMNLMMFIGLFLVLSLMIFAVVNDILCP